jgi:hypothetical protein
MSGVKSKAIPDGYKRWIIASVGVLLVSLAMFTGAIVAWFVYFMQKFTPLWVTVLGVFAVLGIGVGFGGLILVLILCAWRARGDGEDLKESPKKEEA